MTKDLKFLFEPRGVIVTGVSSHPGKFGFVTLDNILSCNSPIPKQAMKSGDIFLSLVSVSNEFSPFFFT